MERVFLKSESRGLMTTTENTAKNINNNIEVVEENTMPEISQENKLDTLNRIKSLLEKNDENIKSDLSTRGNLLIECSLITLNNIDYDIYLPEVNDKFKIPQSELDKWVDSVYNEGLFEVYDKISLAQFKATFKSHFTALKDIASAVQFFLGNFHNAEKSSGKIPFCSVGNMKEGDPQQTAKIPFSVDYSDKENPIFIRSTDEYSTNNRVYVRLEFLTNLENSEEYPIKKRVMTEENGFSQDLIKTIERGQTTYNDFSINQIISMSNPIINYHKFVSKGSDTEKNAIENSMENLTDSINQATDKSNTVLNSNEETKFINMIDVFLSKSLETENGTETVFKTLVKIGKALSNNKKLAKFLDTKKFIFVAKQYKEGGLYNKVKDFHNKN